MASYKIDLETGDLTQFSSTVTDGGDLAAHADAAMQGSYGLKAIIDDSTAIYGQKDWVASPKSLIRVGFYFDPNTLTMAGGDIFDLVNDTLDHLWVRLNYSGGYRVYARCTLDDASASSTAFVDITDAPHWIEAAFYAGAGDGYVKLWIDIVDATPDAENTGLDNDIRQYGHLRFGAAAGLDAGTGGVGEYIKLDTICANDTGDAIVLGSPWYAYAQQ